MGLRCADSSFDILQRAARHLRCHRVNLTTLQGRILGFARPASAASRFAGGGEFFFLHPPPKMARARARPANGARVSRASAPRFPSLRSSGGLRATINPSRVRLFVKNSLYFSASPPPPPCSRRPPRPGPGSATRIGAAAPALIIAPELRRRVAAARSRRISASGNTGYV